MVRRPIRPPGALKSRVSPTVVLDVDILRKSSREQAAPLGAGPGRSVTLILASLLLSTGLTTISTVSAAAATSSSASSPVMSRAVYEKQVQHRVNVVRKAHGLPSLRLASCTDDVAERWNTHLAKNDLFYHQSMWDILDRCDATYAGETLGRGAITPRVLVRMWMHSEGHRAVLMSRVARRIGVASQKDAFGRWVTTADFMRF